MNRRAVLPIGVFLQIAERDEWTCWCGVGYLPGEPWEIDHVRSKRDRGTELVSNLRLSHRDCNRAKGALSFTS